MALNPWIKSVFLDSRSDSIISDRGGECPEWRNTIMTIIGIDSPYRGSAQITREQFLFYEMRATAKLMREGLQDHQVIDRIVDGNLFQYPTEKSVRQMARVCVARLKGMGDEALIEAVAGQSSETAKQICLYAMMKRYRLVWDFMVTVIGEKFRTRDFSFSRMDVNAFLMRLQEQDEYVAGWSEATVNKIRQVLIRILAETDYLDDIRADHINPVWLNSLLEKSIRNSHGDKALAAFHAVPEVSAQRNIIMIQKEDEFFHLCF